MRESGRRELKVYIKADKIARDKWALISENMRFVILFNYNPLIIYEKNQLQK